MPTFVVHEHWATAHHFDFRLEMDGVLKSWAVPKGPPLESGIKRLAVAVDDHPLDYGSFEGNIPAGSYGAGRVVIWDKGDYTLIERAPRVLRFELHGNKLKGEYALIYFKEEGGQEQWLLLKKTAVTASKRK
jgi:bifunctional non-homologous end joining protein LigD